MSIVPNNIEPIIKSLEPAAAAIHKKALWFGKSRFESEIYDHIVPCIALHASLLGSTLLVLRFSSHLGFYAAPAALSFVLTSAVFAAAHLVLRRTRKQVLVGLLGTGAAFLTAAGVFLTAAGVEYPSLHLSVFAAITLPYALISILIGVGVVDPRELRAAPVYSALMMTDLDEGSITTAHVAFLLVAIV
jgi:hypothetical protein